MKWSDVAPVVDLYAPLPRRSVPVRRRLAVALLVGVLLGAVLVPTEADAEADVAWVRSMIAERAEAHGIGSWWLDALIGCESSYRPGATGDHGTSHGLLQLSELPTGLLRHFRSAGYSDPYDAFEAADYGAKVLAGVFVRRPPPLHPFGRIVPGRWSCWSAIGGW